VFRPARGEGARQLTARGIIRAENVQTPRIGLRDRAIDATVAAAMPAGPAPTITRST